MWLALVAIVLGIWIWPALWARWMDGRVTVSFEVITPIVECGEDVLLRCVLTNLSWLPCPRIRGTMQLPGQLHSLDENGLEQQVEFATYLLPRQRTAVTLRFVSQRRGYCRITQSNFELFDGLGIRTLRLSVPVRAAIVVRPKQVFGLGPDVSMSALIGDIQVRRYYNEDPSMLRSIRPYRSGDSLRSIAWHATARASQLMVKEFNHTTTGRCVIVLCGQWSGQSRTTNLDGQDALCERTAEVTRQLLSFGYAVGLYTNLFNPASQRFTIPPSSSPMHLDAIRTHLGALDMPFFPVGQLLKMVPRTVGNEDIILVMARQLDDVAQIAVSEMRKIRGNVVVSVG